MKKTAITAYLLAAVLLLSVLFVSCSASDLPPSDGTPQPAAHDGVFTSEYGSFTFNGDGRSIVIDISDNLSDMSGLPSGIHEGSYVFLFHNEEWRYDKAEYFRIIIGDKSYQFGNNIGLTDENTVSVFFYDGNESVSFTKNVDQ